MGHCDVKKIFSQVTCDLAADGTDIAVVDADLMRIVGSTGFCDAYPERYFQVGIAEQDLIGTAAGMALMGRTVFASTFAVFVTLRAADQIRNAVCYNDLDVKICGIYSGITTEKNGGTHISVEDVAILRAIPNMRIIDPADANEMYAAMKLAAKTPGPFYIRIAKGPLPQFLPQGYSFELGKGVELCPGTDAALITSGLTTAFGIDACSALRESGVNVRHIHMPSIKPIDREIIVKAAKETGMLFVAENHSVIGGLGSAVAEVVCDEYPTTVRRLGITDSFCVGASVSYLADKYDISAAGIARRIKSAVKAGGQNI